MSINGECAFIPISEVSVAWNDENGNEKPGIEMLWLSELPTLGWLLEARIWFPVIVNQMGP